MTHPDVFHLPLPLVSAAFHFIPAFLWSIIAWDLCSYAVLRRPRSLFFRLAPVLALSMALHFALHVVLELTPTQLGGRLPHLHIGIEAIIQVLSIASAAVFRHIVWLLPVREEPPPRRWVLWHYGIAAPLAVVTVAFALSFPQASWPLSFSSAYMIAVGVLAVRQMRRFARQGLWTAGGLELRHADFGFGLVAMAAGGGLMLLWVLSGTPAPQSSSEQILFLLLHTAYGVFFALPFATRMLGRLLRIAVVGATMVAVAAAVVLELPTVMASVIDPELRWIVQLSFTVGLALLLSFGTTWLYRVAAWKSGVLEAYMPAGGPLRRLFQPNPAGALHTFMVTLSPESGVAECCQRATTKIVDAMQLRGAAILLIGSADVFVYGRVEIEPLRRVWPAQPVDVLPTRAFAGAELRELPWPVKEAVLAADVVGVVPITSPLHRWGHLFIATGFLETATSDENVVTLQHFADQLAMVLDNAALVSRTVSVERSLAHAEKLAAIGELAARIAHEIRNPITAARSLAQQLAREPASPFDAEHALILSELERVERQIAALLRFARREEFRFEPVDVAELVRATAEEFRPRLEAAGISLGLDAGERLVASADREKLRQVLINLIENASDALVTTAAPRHLALSVARVNGAAHVRVADNGPGAPPDALPHLFEPFFSRKTDGTGLGLAIAKRTIDAHGGCIRATSPAEAGLVMEIELPLGRPA